MPWGGGNIDQHDLAAGHVLQLQAGWLDRLIRQQVQRASRALYAQLPLQIPGHADPYILVDEDDAFLAYHQRKRERDPLPPLNLNRADMRGQRSEEGTGV
ncbi:hypothetical protein D9M68_893310 [compost metagenome]